MKILITLITLVTLAIATNVQAQALDCDMYSKTSDAFTQEASSMFGRCPDGRSFIDPECKILNDVGVVELTRNSFRTVTCDAWAVGTDILVDDVNENGDVQQISSGETTYNYNIKISGLCCK